MRYALKALGEQTILVIPACCWSIISGPFPYTAIKVPLINTAFETGASTASGVKAGLEMRGDTETTVVAWAGDGGTFDIGLQALSGAAERNDDIIYFCYDNEAYMNTGIQRSSATPWGTWTTTTPTNHPKGQVKKNIMEILAAHRIPYAATCSVAFPEDMMNKIQKARSIHGTRFIHIFAPCPTGWKAPSSLAVKIARLAVHTKVFPLYEVEDGLKYHINVNPKNLPVDEYLRLQGRFAHLTDDEIHTIQETVDREWERLLKKALDTI
jgi:pyruvate/2-oxoacid:ferredoxin oxidoreductase beta subunit